MSKVILDCGVIKLIGHRLTSGRLNYKVQLEGEGTLLSTQNYAVAYDYFHMVAEPLRHERGG